MKYGRKTYPLLAASFGCRIRVVGVQRDVKPAPEFKRTDYERVVVSNGVEPGTLDPQMSGDMAAGAIIRQLMDGWSVRMPKAKPFLLWRKNGRARASVFGPSICVMPNGAMAIRLLPKILYTASAVLPIRPPAHLSAAIWSMPKWKMRKIY